MPTTIEITGLSAVRKDRDSGVYVSWAVGLDLFSQGGTEEEALNALSGAVKMFVRRCYQKGILDETLTKAGFRRISTERANARGFRGVFPTQVFKDRPDDHLLALVSRIHATA